MFDLEGCYNAASWSFKAGIPYTKELEEQIMRDLAQPYVQGLTLLGGEPFLNTGILIPRGKRSRKGLPEKDIWCYSGYLFPRLAAGEVGQPSREILELLDVLVDGPFVEAEKSYAALFRGSANQRLIDVPKSLAAGAVVLWERPDPLAHVTRPES